MFNKRKILALALVMCMLIGIFAFTSCSKKADEGEGKKTTQSNNQEAAAQEKQIVDMKVINGELWVVYSDKPDEPVNIGRVDNFYEGTPGLEFFLLPDGTYGVKGGSTYYLEEIVIPAYYNGVKVTRVLDNAFSSYINLKKVTFPETVTHIDNSAFNACVNLEVATLPLGTKSIGNSAFSNCSSLKSVLIGDQVESIGEFAFMNSISILNTNIPESVKSIGRDAFKNCGGEIYCEVSEQPDTWSEYWNSSSLTVHWGE
ncbi:MAG: leucine-rich repeat domain-containing protein [Ruminococcaceae bacterium]|nr:leucine-rich repeat domain-containing protein [Oscillospiraceae bacterium]